MTHFNYRVCFTGNLGNLASAQNSWCTHAHKNSMRELEMAESYRVPRGVFATVINNQAGNQVNLPNQTLVNATIRVPAQQEVRMASVNGVFTY